MDWTQIEFSVDLIETAVRYLEFLDNADDLEKVLKGPVLHHAICRYEQLWLPFAKAYSDQNIIAPIDIHWVWYLHMLSPIEYRRDCRRRTEFLLDHTFKDSESIIPCLNNTVELWYSEYPKDGFNIIRNGEYVIPQRNKGTVKLQQKSQLSVDLAKTAEGQMYFCYQVALPHFRDRKYLESALGRYKQFLCIKRDNPDEFLTPSVDIMLIWHAHMCSPKAYSTDIMRICDRLLDNDIMVRPAKIMDQNFRLAQQKTDTLWKQVSPESLIKPGAKLRPANSKCELVQMTFHDLVKSCVVLYKMQFTQVKIDGPLNLLDKFDLIFYLDNVDDAEPSTEVLRLHGPRKIWTYSNKFIYNASYHTDMTIFLRQRSQMFCWKGEEDVAIGNINMKQQIVTNFDTFELSCDLKIRTPELLGKASSVDNQYFTVEAEYVIDSADVQVCDMYLAEVSEFKERPAKGTQFPVPAMGRGIQKTQSFVASHRYIKSNRETCLFCDVTHIPELIFSEVRIRTEEGRLVATTHLIGSSQLPAPSQIEGSEATMAFDPELGERVMLIRNFQGDWGLCVGRWVEEADSKGFLEIRFMKLAAISRNMNHRNKIQRLEVRDAFVEFQSFTAHLGTGHVQINPSHNTVGENIATLWSIAILHVLCAPSDPARKVMVSVKNDEPLHPEDVHKEVTRVHFLEEGQCKLLQAVGINTQIPNNEFVLRNFGSLTYDLQMDAQNVMFERRTSNDKLLRRESKKASGELEGVTLIRKLKKKKNSKQLNENVILDGKSEDSPEKSDSVEKKINDNAAEDEARPKTKPEKSKKRLKKHKSSTLDETLPLSDDSITKDDVAEYKFEVDKEGRKKVVAKISSGLPVDYCPSDDSLDELENKDNEFLKDNGLLNVEQEELQMTREHTSIVRDIAERKKAELQTRLAVPSVVEREATRVKFQLDAGDDVTETGTEDTRSDTSSITRETRKMRFERLAKMREELTPLTDEDADGEVNAAEIKRKRRRKRSKENIGKIDPAAGTTGQ